VVLVPALVVSDPPTGRSGSARQERSVRVVRRMTLPVAGSGLQLPLPVASEVWFSGGSWRGSRLEGVVWSRSGQGQCNKRAAKVCGSFIVEQEMTEPLTAKDAAGGSGAQLSNLSSSHSMGSASSL
jgi:hypothetical protein